MTTFPEWLPCFPTLKFRERDRDKVNSSQTCDAFIHMRREALIHEITRQMRLDDGIDSCV